MIALVDSQALSALGRREWDLVVVGGGITGAGILREGARAGLRVLLLEGGDFASGTSSRSSKLVHGGLHYLARLDAGLALEAARERNRLLRSHPGLVQPLSFFLPVLATDPRSAGLRVRALLSAYRLLAPPEIGWADQGPLLPAPLSREGPERFRSVHRFLDARTDDAGLVLRVLAQGVEAGGRARSYTLVAGLLQGEDGQVLGVRIRDRRSGCCGEVRARVVVNATGPWSDALRGTLGLPRQTRGVRGSHLVLPWHRLPLPGAVVHLRPSDGSAVVMVPWMGVTLVGGTSVDMPGTGANGEDGSAWGPEPRIDAAEFRLLLEDVARIFPRAGIGAADVVATFSGIRPIHSGPSGSAPVSAATASRRDGIWLEKGLLTVTGGKLTTFRAMARRALLRSAGHLPPFRFSDGDEGPDPSALPPELRTLASRYGMEGAFRIGSAPPWARGGTELAWCARHEGVVHLDDLLLRRTRIGFTHREGGASLLHGLRPLLKRALGWEEDRWEAEVVRYRRRWQATMAPPRSDGEAGFFPWAGAGRNLS